MDLKMGVYFLKRIGEIIINYVTKKTPSKGPSFYKYIELSIAFTK